MIYSIFFFVTGMNKLKYIGGGGGFFSSSVYRWRQIDDYEVKMKNILSKISGSWFDGKNWVKFNEYIKQKGQANNKPECRFYFIYSLLIYSMLEYGKEYV